MSLVDLYVYYNIEKIRNLTGQCVERQGQVTQPAAPTLSGRGAQRLYRPVKLVAQHIFDVEAETCRTFVKEERQGGGLPDFLVRIENTSKDNITVDFSVLG